MAKTISKMSQILRRNARWVFRCRLRQSRGENRRILIFNYYSTFFPVSSSCFRISFIYRSVKPVILNASKINYSVLSGRNQWSRYGNLRHRQNLLENQSQSNAIVGVRGYAMLIGRVLRGALKLRYVLLGGGVAGTVTFNKVRKIFIDCWDVDGRWSLELTKTRFCFAGTDNNVGATWNFRRCLQSVFVYLFNRPCARLVFYFIIFIIPEIWRMERWTPRPGLAQRSLPRQWAVAEVLKWSHFRHREA